MENDQKIANAMTLAYNELKELILTSARASKLKARYINIPFVIDEAEYAGDNIPLLSSHADAHYDKEVDDVTELSCTLIFEKKIRKVVCTPAGELLPPF